MTNKELLEKYSSLYDYMATSQKTEYMKTFGHVMTEMFSFLATSKPDVAEEYLCKLESIRWNNYLTQKEAEGIVSQMSPKAPWTRDVWLQALTTYGIITEEAPYYNSCALWTMMNMIYSDSSNSIAKIIGEPLGEIDTERMVTAVHTLAIDKLKDKDGMFNIRRYFNL